MERVKIFLFLLGTICLSKPLLASDKVIIDKTFKSEKEIVYSEPFAVSKGDVVEVTVEVDSKRRGLDVSIRQNPGDLVVFDYENLQSGTYQLVAPTDAIYQVFYGGSKVDCVFKVVQHTDRPDGPGHGGIVYVQIPDTVYASGYVDHPIGAPYTISPHVEKVISESSIQPEQVCSRDFFTGVDIVNLSIPADSHDDYRDQKLLGYTVSLVCQSPGVYNKMKGLVETGIDEFTPSLTDVVSMAKKKHDKKNSDNPNSQYHFTNNLEEEESKWENVPDLLSLAADGGNDLGASKNVQAALDGMAFLANGDSIQHLAVHEGLKAFGASDGVVSLVDKVYEMPSTADLLKKGMNQLLPTVQGKAKIEVSEKRLVERPLVEFPQKEFWIQSAMNVGQNPGGCWDVPGKPTAGKNGMDIKCWEIDEGADRRFRIVPAQGYPGYYKIECALPGEQVLVLDNQGGETRMQNDGNNLHLWSNQNTTSQLFRFEHVGNGRFKIYNYDGFIACLANRSNKDGSNIHIWHDHAGAFTEWCFIDPVTKQPFVPGRTDRNALVRQNTIVYQATGGALTGEVAVARPGEPLKPDMAPVDVRIKINKEVTEAKAKLIVEANYLITDYTDVIQYHKEELPAVMTKDFWTAYMVNFDYAIMFKDQLEDYFKVIPATEYYNPKHATSENIVSNDVEQRERLIRYKTLVGVAK